MSNVFIINAHQTYSFSEGKLNKSLVDKATEQIKNNGHQIKFTQSEDDYDVQEEIDKFLWADAIILQMPLNWMSMPWSFKKYIDEVFSLGMQGSMSNGDGRTRTEPKKNYGLAGLLQAKYMISVTANAPKEAFNNPEEKFFNGASEDDLLLPLHLNFKWFGLQPLKTFFAYDVMKNPDVENDFVRFQKHIEEELIKQL